MDEMLQERMIMMKKRIGLLLVVLFVLMVSIATAGENHFTVTSDQVKPDAVYELDFYIDGAWTMDLYCKGPNDADFQFVEHFDGSYGQKVFRAGAVGFYDYGLAYWDGSEYIAYDDHVIVEVRNPENPPLYSNKNEVGINETFYLYWNLPGATDVALWRREADQDYENDYTMVSSVSEGYAVKLGSAGKYYYCIGYMVGDEFHQTNEWGVNCGGDAAIVEELKAKGMTNTWNVLFLIYRNVQTPDYQASFSDQEMANIRRMAGLYKQTMAQITGDRLKIGSVDVLVEDMPVTSVTGDGGSLTYGRGKDVDFYYLLDHRDYNMVIVYAPIGGHPNNDGWGGLGGYRPTYNNQAINLLIANWAGSSDVTFTAYGEQYYDDMILLVHETSHCFESNSIANGWDGFEGVHSHVINGYDVSTGVGHMEYYHDLARDTIRNGRPGFRPSSFYVSHRQIPADKKNGIQADYDGMFRMYKNGLPDKQSFGVFPYQEGRFFVANGTIIPNSGLVSDNTNWYYLSSGQVADYTGLAQYDGAWFYVQNGILDTNYAGLVSYDGGQFMVAAGRILTEANGLMQDPRTGEWVFVAGGQVQNHYRGLALYDNHWFYVWDGVFQANAEGWVEHDGKTFYVVGGMIPD